MYEDIIEFMKKEKRKRKLRKPLKIPLSSDEILLVEEKGKDLKSIGFDWEKRLKKYWIRLGDSHRWDKHHGLPSIHTRNRSDKCFQRSR
ncbi:MAG: hypothetical protein B5M49_02120 [Thermotoga sp. 4484_232]|nr:MAG: hypothetical protein B5M49_02120 [Thermotoga sp. 4484_232]